tara:strand:- start:88 stop:189 length:102 start_codon:yes stop_codon:yes gene_type:complete
MAPLGRLDEGLGEVMMPDVVRRFLPDVSLLLLE